MRFFRFEKSKILSNLHATLSYENFGRLDMVIEAVFEDINIKHKVIQEVEKVRISLCSPYASGLRGFAKFQKFQKSKIKLDRAHPTHPLPSIFFWKPITDMDIIFRSS